MLLTRPCRKWLFLPLILIILGCGGWGDSASVTLLNVSYDPTRELWRELNASFIEKYQEKTGKRIAIQQSHGASSSQARSIIDGLEADVVSLALWNDTDKIRHYGLIREGWEDAFPDRSLPYHSTIVFVVRKGNPKQITDWPDLVRDDVTVITPNPKTSGNGRLSFLAAWGSVVLNGGTDEQATEYMRELYRRVPVLDTAARASGLTFSQKKIGDVHISFENEAQLGVREAKGELEIVYPSVSIKAEPHVAIVDACVDRRQTREISEEYLLSLYTDEGQRIIGKHYYRPSNPEISKEFEETLPAIKLFTITEISDGWKEAQQRFFAEGGVFDAIYTR